jgi:hypothetical protein
VVSRDDGERRKESFPQSGGIIDLDQLLEKPPGGGGRRPERDARDRDSMPMSPSRSNRSARDPEDRQRSDKPGYYDSQPPDGRGTVDQGRGYGSAKDRSIRPADWDDRWDRERR